jgi:hypothetical protein
VYLATCLMTIWNLTFYLYSVSLHQVMRKTGSVSLFKVVGKQWLADSDLIALCTYYVHIMCIWQHEINITDIKKKIIYLYFSRWFRPYRKKELNWQQFWQLTTTGTIYKILIKLHHKNVFCTCRWSLKKLANPLPTIHLPTT